MKRTVVNILMVLAITLSLIGLVFTAQANFAPALALLVAATLSVSAVGLMER